jgi:hypothetical protein
MDPATRTAEHRPSGKTAVVQDYHDIIEKLANNVEAKVIEIRHDLHQNPELPNREVRTAKVIADHLKSLNFDEVRTEVGVHGIVGVLKGGQPGDRVVALRADFDALPVEELADVPFKSTFVDEDYPGGPFPVSSQLFLDADDAAMRHGEVAFQEGRQHLLRELSQRVDVVTIYKKGSWTPCPDSGPTKPVPFQPLALGG